ncbi:PREDICTED: transmembrane protein 138 isoform X1 [Vollenhovia emeryi]|uniref:transmembrane protein 138 isoform X1 n=1 Tax=Vollenhovia emeryi TaxID=411798 RepID=UPI0005F3BD6A|nr:PREDICTED: transmembrane protein 138 isoform X1 [Vollenhovia emeryi]
MNSLNTRQYTAIVILQYVVLLFDVCVNSFASFARRHPTELLVLYVIQDFCLIVALTLLLVNFFSTYIFQAGLIQLLYTRFRMTLVLCIIYMILSISLHTWHITIHWSAPLKHYWTRGFHVLYSAHRTGTASANLEYRRALNKRMITPRVSFLFKLRCCTTTSTKEPL